MYYLTGEMVDTTLLGNQDDKLSWIYEAGCHHYVESIRQTAVTSTKLFSLQRGQMDSLFSMVNVRIFQLGQHADTIPEVVKKKQE